ncbi:MAG: hypothetical protein R6W76_15220, partial [Caldilinea sp.]
MAYPRSPRSLRRLDMSKYAVLLALAVIAIVLLAARSCEPQQIVVVPTPDATLIPAFTVEATSARPVLISPLTGAPVTAGAIELRGEGMRGHSIRVRNRAGDLIATAPVDSESQWMAVVQIDEPGEAALVLELVDLAGKVVAAAAPVNLNVTVPSVAVRSPSLDSSLINATLTAGLLALNGSGEPGSTVEIVVDGVVVTSTTVDDEGRWTAVLRANAPGVYAVALQAVDDTGQIIATATPAILSIAPPAQPVVAVPPTSTPSETPTPPFTETATSTPTAVDTPTPIPTDTPTPPPTDTSTPTDTATPLPADTATPTETATETPTAAPPALDKRSFDGGGPTTLTGSGTPGEIVRVTIDGAPAGTTVVDAQGRWQLLVELIQSGSYTLAVESVTLEGIVRAAAEPFVVDIPTATNTATPVPTITSPPTDTATPTSTSTTTATPIPTDTATPTNTATLLPTETATPAPTDTATTTNTPAPTATATATPTVAPPTLDESAFDSGGPTTLSGSGAPGEIVRVTIDGAPVGTTVVDAQGRWQLLVELAQSGRYTLAVENITLEGVVRAAAEPFVVDISTATNTATPVPTITSPPTDTAAPTSTSTTTATPIPTDTATPTN